MAKAIPSGKRSTGGRSMALPARVSLLLASAAAGAADTERLCG
ncbi:MAG: hypothetical protein ACJ8G3_03615 [Burkholderiaceae bacterium]